MDISDKYQKDAIEDEPSNEEKLLLSHMNSEDLYPEEIIQNVEEELADQVNAKKEDSNVIKQNCSTSHNENNSLEKTFEEGIKQLEDSLEIKKEELPTYKHASFKKKELGSVKIFNEKIELPRSIINKGISKNANNSSLNISNDRYSEYNNHNKNNTDDDDLREIRIVKNSKSMTNFVLSQNFDKDKKEKNKKIEMIERIEISERNDKDRERDKGRDKHDIKEYELKDIKDKEIFLNGNIIYLNIIQYRV